MLRNKHALWLLTASLMLVCVSAYAQPGTSSSAEPMDRATERKLKEANRLFQDREFMEAATLYEEILGTYSNSFDITYKVGRCHFYMRNTQSEIEMYNSAIAINPDGSDTIYFDLATALMRNGEYDNARSTFNTFLQRYQTQDDFRNQAQVRLQGCEYAISQQNVDPDYRITLVDGVNMEGTDFNPTPYIIRGDTFMIYTSHQADNRGRRIYNRLGEEFSDLWIAHYTTDTTYGEVENMGKRINTKANDGSATVSPDGLTIYYTICGKGKQRKKHGCSIFMSEFNPDAKTWGRYQIVEGINGEREVVTNSRGRTRTVPTSDMYPTLDPTGNVMYFVSDRDGGQGSTDIWYSTRIGNAWSTPVNAGNRVNTAFSETAPSVGADGQSIYFSSDGHPGYGGYDIFRATGRMAAYDSIANLGRDLNSSYDDVGVNWLYQDSIGYIASNRPGGPGKFDIYRVQFIYKPPLDITVRGTIRDLDTREPVPFAIVTLYEEQEDGSRTPIDTFQTDQTGAYQFILEEEKNYCMVGNAPEYFANDTCVTTKGARERIRNHTLEVPLVDNRYVYDLRQDVDILLKHIKIDEPIVLQNVYFDFDSANVRPDAANVLQGLITILRDNPNITIQMGAHTDCNGTERYNKDLSDRRAKSVVRFLTENGIAADRLTWMGYGESQPMIYPEMNATDEQSNRRVEFRVKSINYVPGAAAPAPSGRR